MGTTPADISFVASCGESEVKTVALKIEDVAEFLKMSNKELEENGTVFNAGKCTDYIGEGSTARWKYYFERAEEDQDKEGWFGGFLKLECASIVNSAKASYSVSLSSGGKPISSFTVERQEFAGSGGWGCPKMITKSELLRKTKGDVLEVNLRVKVFSAHSFKPIQKTPSTLSAVELKRQAKSDFVKMFNSGDGADVEIKVPSEVGGKVYESSHTKKAHKGILMARSSVFSKMFAKESTMTEAQTGKVVIKDLTPKGLNIFLYYLYTGEVLQDWFHVVPELLNAAEKYDCGSLKQYCGLNILDAVSTNNAAELYKLAKLHGLLDAAKRIADFVSENAEAVMDQVVEESK